ncbi:hypothetical protein LTR56_022970 [Elasticomyces elasticus]|nr:hypothetical protein LTR56_022970 [Elasticomyces elasticus]KAK3627001.1 hypothetical protein LTR22_022958 [Elasticomyces elasticus]KAK4910843.1 hypothetical protein LTR49_020538 [Elasticomyces elasticus]KAK5750421.1 hypothetical protein LTS12_019529 [Elasticomyces elasticus]
MVDENLSTSEQEPGRAVDGNMSMSEHSESASEADWSAASDASGMFETFVEPPQQYYHDYVNTGATLTLNAEISRPALTHPEFIRLIVVEPASKTNAPIHLSFVVTTLAAPRDYYGFSYAWGPTHADGSHLTDTVYLDSLPLRVTAHLHSAFKNIRRHAHRVSRTDLLTLWSDTLCINQQNLSERNSRVTMMGRIYAEARAVLLWIGTPRADCYRRLKKAKLSEERGVNASRRELCTARSVMLPTDVSEWILDQAYFTRRWVVQEVSMKPNRVVLVADQLITFDSLTRNYGKDLPPLCRLAHAGVYVPLLVNLIWYSTTECSDPRDRLFALLAISERNHGITPDYSKSYADLYTGFASSCIRQGKLSAIFACAAETRRCSRTDTVAMPSWVPDWRQCLPTATVDQFAVMNVQTDNATELADDDDQVQFDAQVYPICKRREGVWSTHQHRNGIQQTLADLCDELRSRGLSPIIDDGHPDDESLVMCVLPGARYVVFLSSYGAILSSNESIHQSCGPERFKLVDGYLLAEWVPWGITFDGFMLEAHYMKSRFGESTARTPRVAPGGIPSKEGLGLVLITSKHTLLLENEYMTVVLV